MTAGNEPTIEQVQGALEAFAADASTGTGIALEFTAEDLARDAARRMQLPPWQQRLEVLCGFLDHNGARLVREGGSRGDVYAIFKGWAALILTPGSRAYDALVEHIASVLDDAEDEREIRCAAGRNDDEEG